MHHSDLTRARHGADPWQIDVSASVVRIFERFGWATGVHCRAPGLPDSRPRAHFGRLTGVGEFGVNKSWRVPPDEAGDHAQGDRGQVCDGPVQQHGGCHLRAIPVVGAGGQRGDQSEFGDSETPGGDGQYRCEHLDGFSPVMPRWDYCQDCRAGGGRWKALWVCLTCGWVACSDDSPSKHAKAHYQETDHPLAAGLGAGSRWRWCYVHRRPV